MRPDRSTVLTGLVAIGLLAVTTSATAQPGEAVQFHGFGGWAAGHTNNDNVFARIASGDTEFNNYYFALNLAAQPSEKLSIHSQAFWGEDIRGQRTTLDYAFVQWAQSSTLKLRVGKVLSPFGLYTEIFDVGTLRPFYLLPQSMYAGGAIVAKSYLGAGITGNRALGDDWEISYDLYGGEIQMQDFDLETPVGFDPVTRAPVFQKVNVQLVGRDVVGTTIMLGRPASGLNLGASFMRFEAWSRRDGGPRTQTGRESPQDDKMVAGHFEYLTDKVTFRAEAYRISGADAIKLGYAEAAYRVYGPWQAAARFEKYDNKTPSAVEKVPWSQLFQHEAWGFGLSYWANPNFVVKLDYFKIDGNVFAKRDELFTHAAMGTLEEKTDAWILGTQFSF